MEEKFEVLYCKSCHSTILVLAIERKTSFEWATIVSCCDVPELSWVSDPQSSGALTILLMDDEKFEENKKDRFDLIICGELP